MTNNVSIRRPTYQRLKPNKAWHNSYATLFCLKILLTTKRTSEVTSRCEILQHITVNGHRPETVGITKNNTHTAIWVSHIYMRDKEQLSVVGTYRTDGIRFQAGAKVFLCHSFHGTPCVFSNGQRWIFYTKIWGTALLTRKGSSLVEKLRIYR